MSNVLWYEQKKLFTNTAALRHTNLFYRLLKRPNSTEECWLILSRHQEKGKKICVFKTIISIGKKYSGLTFLLEQRILKLYKHVFFVVFHTFFGSFVYFFFKFLFKHKFNAHNLQRIAWNCEDSCFLTCFGDTFENGAHWNLILFILIREDFVIIDKSFDVMSRACPWWLLLRNLLLTKNNVFSLLNRFLPSNIRMFNTCQK